MKTNEDLLKDIKLVMYVISDLVQCPCTDRFIILDGTKFVIDTDVDTKRISINRLTYEETPVSRNGRTEIVVKNIEKHTEIKTDDPSEVIQFIADKAKRVCPDKSVIIDGYVLKPELYDKIKSRMLTATLPKVRNEMNTRIGVLIYANKTYENPPQRPIERHLDALVHGGVGTRYT